MAAKSWETDFRREAIRASIERLADFAGDPADTKLSYCLPLHGRPIVGLTPGKIYLVALILGFALLIGGAVLGSLAKGNEVLLTIAVCCSLTGMACLFASVFDRFLLRCLLGDRGSALAERSRLEPLLSAEVSDADRSKMSISIDGDDQVLIFVDQTNRRLVMEGVACRYQILAEDVLEIRPFEFMNYVGVELEYRIGDTRLRLALARVSLLVTLIQQAPVFFFLKGLVSKRLYQRVSAALGAAAEESPASYSTRPP